MASKRKAITRDSPEADEVLLSDGGEDIDIGPLNALLPASDDEEDAEGSEGSLGEDSDEFDGFDEDDSIESGSDIEGSASPTTTPDYEDKPNYRTTTDANGNPRYVYDEIDPVYDSDDSDAAETANTIGNISLSFYDAYPHIGYDINGMKISRPAKGEALDQLLDSIDIPKGWTGLTDPATGKPLQLSQDELELLKRVQLGEAPEEGYNPYPEMVEWFTSKEEIMPLNGAPEPKRRFVPSKHEQKRVMKLVKAIRDGHIQPYKPPEEREQDEDEAITRYDIWADEAPRADNAMHMPAPKLAPPGFEESYNPPAEYLPDENEKREWEEADDEDREKDFLPTGHDALRKVPGYDKFVKEKFERCLDLYLAPRVRRNKLNIDPESLLPKLPSPEELRPFPSGNSATMRGHSGRVRSVAVDPTGFWAATGGDDGTVRIWDIALGRQVWHLKLGDDEAVNVVQWRPGRDAFILSAACGDDLYFIVPPLCNPDLEAASRAVLDAGWGYAATANGSSTSGASKAAPWARPGAKLEASGVLVRVPVRQTIKHVSWHRRGEYLVTVSPEGQGGAVAVMTLSKHVTQYPFRKPKGRAQSAHFHPSRPILFVATQKAIRSWDLSKSTQLSKIVPGATWISDFSVHPGGDNLLVSSYDKRLLWHDLELSNYPHKTLRYHTQAIRSVSFHKTFPLFADASDDGTLQVFHGRVANDAMENATIVPLKMLRGHKVVQRLGVLGLDWMGNQPWLLSAGADGTARLWT